jgi:hypothetical protein
MVEHRVGATGYPLKKSRAVLILLLAAVVSSPASALGAAYEVRATGGTAAFESISFAGCPGDCDGDLQVEVFELVNLLNVALGKAPDSDCPVAAAPVTIDTVVQAVAATLDGCPRSGESTTPTPTPTPTTPPLAQGCEECCDQCSDSTCFRQCFGVEPCRLVTLGFGDVTDASTGAPIEGAEVTFNGTSTTTGEDGSYRVLSIRPETCHALDYRYEWSVETPGYEPFASSFFRTIGDTQRYDFALVPLP